MDNYELPRCFPSSSKTFVQSMNYFSISCVYLGKDGLALARLEFGFAVDPRRKIAFAPQEVIFPCLFDGWCPNWYCVRCTFTFLGSDWNHPNAPRQSPASGLAWHMYLRLLLHGWMLSVHLNQCPLGRMLPAREMWVIRGRKSVNSVTWEDSVHCCKRSIPCTEEERTSLQERNLDCQFSPGNDADHHLSVWDF